MAGDLSNLNVTLDFSDNFHRVYSSPIKLPHIHNTCSKGGDKQCVLKGYTISENYYVREWAHDIGLTPVGAEEQKVKMTSRESMQWHAGNKDTNYTKDDTDHTICESINQKAIDWAMSKADTTAKEMYLKHGKKLVVGKDLDSAHTGPTWVWDYMGYDDNKSHTETVVTAPNMETPLGYMIKSLEGSHYCKLLSVFRALEWIHIDSIKEYSKRALAHAEEEDMNFLQL